MAAPPLLDRPTVLDQLADLPNWQLFDRALHAKYDAPDVPTAVDLVAEVFEVAEELNHHPDTDLRWRRVQFALSTHEAGGVTGLDIELAQRIARAAAERGATAMTIRPSRVAVGIETARPEVIAPVWAAALDCTVVLDETGTVGLKPAAGGGPAAVWFDQAAGAAAGPGRPHVDVWLSPEEAARRREALDAAGARLVTARFAPAWWGYADQDGNELRLCTGDEPDGS